MEKKYFISIDIDIAVAERLMALQQELEEHISSNGMQAQWVYPEQLHLSMKYLGAVEPALIPHIEESLDNLVLPLFPFQIHHRNIITDTKGRPTRNIFSKLDKKGGEVVTLLHQALEKDLLKIGMQTDARPFYPRIHLGRLKGKIHTDKLQEIFAQYAQDNLGTSTIKDFALWSGETGPEGPVYTVLNRFTLGGRHEPI